MFGFDWTYLIIIPALIFSMFAQYKVSSTFKKFDKSVNKNGLIGADVARILLDRARLFDVKVEKVSGNLTDHYDPRSKTIRLSDSVFNSRSLAAIGVAAHEIGHAIQDGEGYTPLNIRSNIFPVVNIGSNMAMPIFLIGFILTQFANFFGEFGIILIYAGIILFTLTVVFSLVTLPVEFNASARAINSLQDERILTEDEINPARKVLNAAALTYVASAAMAVAQLIRLILLAGSRSRD